MLGLIDKPPIECLLGQYCYTCIFARWLRDSHGKQVLDSQTSLPILEFVSIQRKDSGEWAIPGVCGDVIFSQLVGFC